jgi:hypothetical protein
MKILNDANDNEIKCGWDAILLLREDVKKAIKENKSCYDRGILSYDGRKGNITGIDWTDSKIIIRFPDGNGFWIESKDIQVG